MFVEATLMKGKGEVVLTGQLGDVMKESARAAWTLRPLARGAPRHPRRGVRARPPHPRAGRRDPEGRAVGGHRDGDGDRLGPRESAGAPRHRDDGRDHALRPRPADRRTQGEGARRRPRGHPDDRDAPGQRAGPLRAAERGAGHDHRAPRGRPRRGARRDAAGGGAPPRAVRPPRRSRARRRDAGSLTARLSLGADPSGQDGRTAPGEKEPRHGHSHPCPGRSGGSRPRRGRLRRHPDALHLDRGGEFGGRAGGAASRRPGGRLDRGERVRPRAHAGRKDALLLPDGSGAVELPGDPRVAEKERRHVERTRDRALFGPVERPRPLDLARRPAPRLRFEAAPCRKRGEEGLRPLGRRPRRRRLVGAPAPRGSREQPAGRNDDVDRVRRDALSRFDALRRPGRPRPLHREARGRRLPPAGTDHRAQHRARRLECIRHPRPVAPRVWVESIGRSRPGAVLGVLRVAAGTRRLERLREAARTRERGRFRPDAPPVAGPPDVSIRLVQELRGRASRPKPQRAGDGEEVPVAPERARRPLRGGRGGRRPREVGAVPRDDARERRGIARPHRKHVESAVERLLRGRRDRELRDPPPRPEGRGADRHEPPDRADAAGEDDRRAERSAEEFLPGEAGEADGLHAREDTPPAGGNARRSRRRNAGTDRTASAAARP